jgi:hypothetical protein
LGLNVKQRALKALLAQYKHLEQEIVTLTSMAQDDCYHTMLVERLGLTNWGLQQRESVFRRVIVHCLLSFISCAF